MKKVTIYSDGSSLNNPGSGGYCAILIYKNNEKVISGGASNTTNNRMELLAIIEGLNALKDSCEVDIFSDSTYVVKGINEWLSNWIKKDFKNIKNEDLWKRYIKIAENHKITLHWIKAHVGNIFNERCDTIAKEEALRIKNGRN